MLTGDRGSAVVEFVLVGTLLVALFLGVLQLGLYLHMRNVVVASLAEGAREAANADRDCADGTARTIADQAKDAPYKDEYCCAVVANGQWLSANPKVAAAAGPGRRGGIRP